MAKAKKYRFNSKTLSYEFDKESPMRHLGRGIGVLLLSLALFFFFLWLMTSVLHKDLPKTFILRMENVHWQSEVDLMNRRMDAAEATLDEISRRDNQIYRSLFGLGEIPSSVRDAGISGVSRIDELVPCNAVLAASSRRLDRLLKKATVQSRSFDEVEALSMKAGLLALCIPAICPLSTEEGTFSFSSRFGWRTDSVYACAENFTGVDLAINAGNPIYATGDGVVEQSEYQRGYGNIVTINHGFGYKTRYAHMKESVLKVGDTVKRGDHVGYVGSTGKSTGNHLHYEVIFRGRPVNPTGFMDMEMPYEDYKNIVTEVPIMKGCRKTYR